MKWCCLVLFCFGQPAAVLGAESPQWAFESVTDGWNDDQLARMYFHHSELQRQWAWELLGKQTLIGTEKILDFGCGDGKVSAEISRLVPNGQVIGVDISTEMLRLAHLKFPPYAYPNLAFIQGSSLLFDDIPGSADCDIVCSFCVFHQIANSLDVLCHLREHLKEDGKLILVIPAGKNPEFFQAAGETFREFGLEAPWKRGESDSSIRTVEGCFALLQRSGYEPLVVEMVDTDNPFYEPSELVAWMIGTTAANWKISASLCQAFFSALVDRMWALDPQIIDEEGRVHFKLSRIHVVARKKANS